VSGKDKDLQKPAAAAVTKTAPREPTVDISNWKTTDVQKWLKRNNLQRLQTWYDIIVISSQFYRPTLLPSHCTCSVAQNNPDKNVQ